MKNKKQAGMTLVEIMLTIAIMAIITVPMAYFLSDTLKGVTSSNTKVDAQEKARMAMSKIEPVLFEANQLFETTSGSIGIIVDSVWMPGYDPNADYDNDLIINIMDPDIDDDAPQRLLSPATAQWTMGYNLTDDDDDNNDLIDCRFRIYRTGTDLFLAYSENEGAYSAKLIAKNVTVFNIIYYGSKREQLGASIDLGNDGVVGPPVEISEGDGLITEREIDMVVPPVGHGNQSGSIDTENERRYIVSFRVELGIDSNKDGTADYVLRPEFAPPLLPLKRAL